MSNVVVHSPVPGVEQIPFVPGAGFWLYFSPPCELNNARATYSSVEEAVGASDRLLKQYPHITSVEVMRGADGFCPAVRVRSRDGDELGWRFRAPTPGTFFWDKVRSRFVVSWEGEVRAHYVGIGKQEGWKVVDSFRYRCGNLLLQQHTMDETGELPIALL